MKKALLALAAVLALVLTASALGDDFSQGNGANATANWKVLSLGAVSDSWNTKGARAFDDGIGFAFGADPYTRFFLTSHQGSGLLGDLTGKTLTATFTITGTATAFTYDPGPPASQLTEKNEACPTPASVRLYFKGNNNGNGNLTPDKQWWSTPQAYTLTSLVGNTLTLTVPLDTANWTNKDFQLASDVPTDFAAAVATVGAVGVSFGGGCFLPTGAVPTDGTASFVLKSYSVS
jgi:hypothetical protein